MLLGSSIFLPRGANMASSSAEVAPAAARKPLFGSCWSCRILSGMALIASSVWVYLGPRRVMKQGIPPNLWHITLMTFSVGLFSAGAVVIVDPVGKMGRKEE